MSGVRDVVTKALIRAFHGSTDRGLKSINARNAIETPGVTFHASNPDVAETFTFPREYGEMLTYDPVTGRELKRGRVYETQLTPRNMFEVPAADAQRFIDDSAYQAQLVRQLKERGHDAFVARNVLEGIGERSVGDVYGAMDDSIIKIMRKYGAVPAAAVPVLGGAFAQDKYEAVP